MYNRIAFAFAAIALTATAYAYSAEQKEARPVACLDYSIAKLADGSSIGMCEGRKGKKPRLMRSFAVTKVTNPDTGAAATLLVGFP
jgi:hypothetical protein